MRSIFIFDEDRLMTKQVRYHGLDLSYEEFVSMSKNISYSNIGKYCIYQKIGEGGFGQVYKAMHEDTKLVYAVKVIDIRSIMQEGDRRMRQIRLQLAQSQDKIMSLCSSDYIVQCYDVYKNEDLKLIVMEYCNKGTLSSYIEEKRIIPEKEAILIVKQIINGVAKLHQLNIIHRDLKTENILLHNNLVKIADFGLSKVLPQKESTITFLGSKYTMAPEVLMRERYNHKADIWSIGVIFYKMLFGRYPFQNGSMFLTLSDITESAMLRSKKLTVNGIKISQQSHDLLKQVLVVDQERRIGWKQLLAHPIFEAAKNPKKIEETLIQNISLISLNPQDSRPHYSQPPQLEGMSRLQKISSGKVKKLIQQIELSQQEKQFKWVSLKLNECLKAQLIFEEVIEKIEEYGLLDLQKREVIEFMYLIATRCFLDLSPIRNQMVVMGKKNTSYQDIYDSVEQLYQRLKTRWEYYLKTLTDVQNQLLNRLKDFLQSKQTTELKNILMNGIENVDYSKVQQLTFIEREYIKLLLPQIRPVGSSKVRDLLIWYKEVNLVEAEVYSREGFEAYINRLIQH